MGRRAASAIRPQSRKPHTRIGASTNRYDRSASAIVTMTHQIALTMCWKVPGAVRMSWPMMTITGQCQR